MNVCPNCGKRKKNFIESLCVDCYSDSNSLISGFKDITIEKCAKCDAFRYKRRFTPDNIINKIVKDNIIPNKFARITSVSVELDRKDLLIVIEGTFHKKTLKEDYVLPIKLIGVTCPKCGKKGTEYFEGILQIRSNLHSMIEKSHPFVLNELKRGDKRGCYCNKTVKQKNGIDYFITSKSYVQELAQKVFNEFGYEIKINAQLFSRNKQTSKDLFRVNAFVQLPDFIRGDVLFIENKLVKVYSVKRKQLNGHDLNQNKDIKFKINDDKYDIIATSKDYHELEVIQNKPNVKVLHPVTYQATMLENPRPLEVGDKIKVLVIEDRIWFEDKIDD